MRTHVYKKLVSLAGALAVAFQFASASHAAVIFNQPATDDAIVRSSSERKNYGSEPILQLKTSTFGGVSEAYLRFGFPPYAQLANKAVLRFFAQLDGNGSAQLVVRRVTDTNWSEAALAWSWRPEHGAAVGSVQIVGVSGAWYEIDVTEFVRAEIAAGKQSASFVLVPGEGAKQPIQIRSREAQSHQPELVVSRPLFTAKVCFLPRSASAPQGCIADHGDVFGSRSSGFTFGWNKDNRSQVRDRNDSKYVKSKNPPMKGADRRYDFFAYMDNERMTNRVHWEMQVPNGSYKVRIIAGDGQRYDSIFGLSAEKTVVLQGVPDKEKRWLEGTAIATVNDGRITIDNTPSSSNNKLCFVEITETKPTLLTRTP